MFSELNRSLNRKSYRFTNRIVIYYGGTCRWCSTWGEERLLGGWYLSATTALLGEEVGVIKMVSFCVVKKKNDLLNVSLKNY